MKSSNLAVRRELHDPIPEGEPASPPARVDVREPASARRRRPRPSLGFRAIVLRDQGLPLFRVR